MSSYEESANKRLKEEELDEDDDGDSEVHSSAVNKGKTRPGVRKRKPFVLAAYDMANDPANANAIGFTTDGKALEIRDVSLFCDQVLPKSFKHKNMSSFIRQLNMYGFEKVAECAPCVAHTFRHEFFQRDREDLLEKVSRKPVGHKAPGTKSRKHAAHDDDEDGRSGFDGKRFEAQKVVEDLARLKKAQSEHEARIKSLEQGNQSLTEENQILKSQIKQVKEVQDHMMTKLKKLVYYFYNKYNSNDDARTVFNILESSPGPLLLTDMKPSSSSAGATDPQLLDEIFKRLGDPSDNLQDLGPKLFSIGGIDDLSRNHSLISAAELAHFPSIIKPSVNLQNPEYEALSKEIQQTRHEQGEALKKMESITSSFGDLPSFEAAEVPEVDDSNNDDEYALKRSQ